MAYEDPFVVCAPWIDVADLCDIPTDETDCNGVVVPLVYPDSITDMIMAVSNILFGLTCYRYPGICTTLIYPCLDCACGCHPCSCGRFDAIDLAQLPYPVQSVVQVLIDGVAVNPLEYTLKHNRYLVKLSGDEWPNCNAMDLPDSSSSTLTVEVEYGRTPPIELRMGAARLVEELYKACNQSPCDLPSNVTKVTRRGIDFDMTPLTQLMESGKTGIDILDYALQKYGKCNKMWGYDPSVKQSYYRAP